MLEARFSTELERLRPVLTDAWEAEALPRLPFPVAYVLGRLRSADYAWDLLTKDSVSALVRYLAVVGVSDYLHAGAADLDLNERLQKLAQPMVEGNWLAMANGCASRTGETVLPAYAVALRAAESGKLRVSLSDPRYGLHAERAGLLSALLNARNKLYAHGVSLSEAEKTQARPILLVLMRAAIHALEPLWQVLFVATVTDHGRVRTLALHGVEGFREAEPLPPAVHCALRTSAGGLLPLEPLAFPGPPAAAHQGSLLDAQGEVYVLNQLNRRRVPEYTGVGGGQLENGDLAPRLSAMLDSHKVWETRTDIELSGVLEYAKTKALQRLADLDGEGLYDPMRTVRREGVEGPLCQLLQDTGTRALFVAGSSGSGKTTAVLDWVRRQVEAGVPALVLRATELPSDVVKRKRLCEYLAGQLGTLHPFAAVLERAATASPSRFLLVIDGLNEFTGQGRDGSLLFRAVYGLLEDAPREAALRVVVSARSDGLAQFLPKRTESGASEGSHQLPADAEEELWRREDGRPYLEVPPMSTEEAERLVRAFGADSERARELVEAVPVRSPDILRKAALGALDAADLRQLDARGVTSRLLESRLGRDRALRGTVEELVKTMGRARELAMDEALLEKTAPRLHRRLRENGDRLLTTLRELGIVQVIPRTTEDGQGRTWALALTHDSLFEALMTRLQRQRLRFRLIFSSGLVATLFAVLYVVLEGMSRMLSAKGDRVAAELHERVVAYGQSSVASADLARYMEAWKAVEQALRISTEAVVSSLFWLMLDLLAVVCPVLLLFLVAGDLVNHYRESRSRREIRTLFFGRDDDLSSSRRFMAIVVPIALAALGWAVVRVLRTPDVRSLGQFAAVVWPLLALLLALIVLALPATMVLQLRRAWRGSPLLWDYRFGEEGLVAARSDLRFLSGFLIVGLLLVILLINARGEWFFSRGPLLSARAAVKQLELGADWPTLQRYPAADASKARQLLSGQPLDEGEKKLERDLLSKSLIPRDDPDRPIVLTGLLAVGSLTLISMWASLLITQAVARRRGPPLVRASDPE